MADFGGVFIGFERRAKTGDGPARFKGAAVFGSETVGEDGSAMTGRAIADVMFEIVVGVVVG